MKFNKAFLISILALGAFILSSCKGDNDEPGEEEIFIGKLAQTWNLAGGQVTVDGVNVTQDFEGMTLTFTADKRYTTSHGVPPIWPAGGTFTLKKSGDNIYDLTRDDGVLVSVSALSDKSITLELQYTSPVGRASNVSGKFQFVMTR